MADPLSCSTPSGAASIPWVFPEAPMSECVEIFEPGRVFYNECEVPLSDGSTVELHYSQWHRRSEALDHYDSRGPGDPVANPERSRERLRWFNISGEGLYKVAAVYPVGTWSATAYATTDAGRAEALRTFLRMRPADELRGVAAP